MTLSPSDRFAISELIAMHGHLTDDGELDRYDEVFTDDVVYDLTDSGLGELRGLPAIRDAARVLGDANPVGHHVTNTVIEEVRDGVVSARSKGIGVMAEGTTGSLTYEDLIERRHDEWRISRRKVVLRRRPLGA
jgi:3-phenylpropionate/cinnamic acid dioxygenase small subunit